MTKDPSSKKPVAFSRPVARRVVAAVRRVERSGHFQAPGPSSGGYGPWTTPMPASVTTAIPTGTLAAPSDTGRVTIYRDDDAGGLAAAETDQECHNYHTLSASVPIGTTVTVYWRANCFWLVQPDCY